MLSPHTSYRWRGERVIEPIKWMHSPHTSYRWRGERVIEPIKWMHSPHTSYRWRGERVIEPIKCMRSPHTSYRWRGERVIEPIKCMRSPHTSYRCRGLVSPSLYWGKREGIIREWIRCPFSIKYWQAGSQNNLIAMKFSYFYTTCLYLREM